MTFVVNAAAAAVFAWLGWTVSLEDGRTGLVKNSKIIIGLKACALALAVLFIGSAINSIAPRLLRGVDSLILFNLLKAVQAASNPALLFKFYPAYLLHAALTALAAVVLWKARFWPAGDAKFFIVMSLLLPLIRPNIKMFPAHLFLAELLNIFIPACFYFVVSLGLRLGVSAAAAPKPFPEAKEKAEAWFLKKWAEIKPRKMNYLFLAVNFFVLFSVSQVARLRAHHYLAKLVNSEVAVFVVLFLVWDRVYGFMMRKSSTAAFLVIMGGYLALGSVFFPERILGDILRGMSMVVRLGMLLMLLKAAVNYYFSERETRRIPLEELRPGMILDGETTGDLKKDPDFFRGNFGTAYCDGLTADQLEAIRFWGRAKTVGVCQTKPFAVWIALGSAATLLMQTDAINFVRTNAPFVAALFR